jgi:hypothetical protein
MGLKELTSGKKSLESLGFNPYSIVAISESSIFKR